jgi:hypothetical protein
MVDPAKALTAELSIVVLLALTAAAGPIVRCALAIGVAAALGVATLLEPYDTSIVLAMLHNLTPLVFLWEITPRSQRWQVMSAALAIFVALPLLVASGLPREALAALDGPAPSLDPLHAGPLSAHLYVYAPVPLLRYARDVDLFSASVVAQCAHYAAVIVVLPLVLQRHDPRAEGLVPWPRGIIFATIVALAAAVALSRFAADFGSARALYGIAASVHAWIEIPLIVVALTARYGSNASARPTAQDAPLVASDSHNARTGDSATIQAISAASIMTTAVSPSAPAGK